MPRPIARQKERRPDAEAITHTSYALYYHLVWGTAQWDALINPPLRAFLRDFLARRCAELGVHIRALGLNPDHVHLVLSLKPSHRIPELVQAL
jgi:REP element-mobilizing transposase RayT